MRHNLLVLTVALSFLALPGLASAQTASAQPPSAGDSKSPDGAPAHDSGAPADANVAPADAPQPDAPMSLGEVARLARAKKSSQPKSMKLFDDDNMPRAPLVAGAKAPGFASEASTGGGKVTLLDFWATWCGPCRQALPELKKLASVYGGGNFELISVNEDDDEGSWRDFIAQNGMSWTQRFDLRHEMARQYGASGLPTYVLIGKDGNVVQQYVGEDPSFPVIERIGPDIKKSLDQRQ